MFVVRDKKAQRAELAKRATTPLLTRIEVGQGKAITSDPAGALRNAAAAL